MSHDNISTNHTEKKMSYVPVAITVILLGLIATFLLNSFHRGGNIWVNKEKTEAHKSQDKE